MPPNLRPILAPFKRSADKKRRRVNPPPKSDTLSNVRPTCVGNFVSVLASAYWGLLAALAGQPRIAGVSKLCFALYHIRNRIDCKTFDADLIMEVRTG